MHIDFSPRRSGKTTRIALWLRGDKQRFMIAFNRMSAIHARREFPDVKSQILTLEEFKERMHRPRPRYELEQGQIQLKGVAIDNADLLLSDILGVPLSMLKRISVSSYEKELMHTMQDIKFATRFEGPKKVVKKKSKKKDKK